METTASLKQELADAQKLANEQEKKVQLLREKIKKEEEANKPKSILDRIKSFDDILAIAKEKGYKYSPNESDSKDEVAEKKIKLACLVVNEGWIPSKKVERWYPYFSLSSGFVFSYSYCEGSYSFSYCGFRLCLKDEKTSNFIGKTFIDLYEDMHTNIEY